MNVKMLFKTSKHEIKHVKTQMSVKTDLDLALKKSIPMSISNKNKQKISKNTDVEGHKLIFYNIYSTTKHKPILLCIPFSDLHQIIFIRSMPKYKS